MRSMRVIIGAVAATFALAACGDERSITSEPQGALGFGTVYSKTSTNLPRGTVTYPVAIVASATPASDSVIVTLAGLDSLTTGTYTLWFANDSATKWVRVTSMNVTSTKIDSSTNAIGDPVFTTTVVPRNGVSGFRAGGPNVTFRVATARNQATGMAATDSLNTVLVSVETAAPGAAPGEVRALWTRRSQANATTRIAPIRFGTFKPRIPAQAGSPGANDEFVVATNGVMTIIPRGRIEVRGKIMISNDSNFLRPPVGYYYNSFALKLDTVGRVVDSVYLGRKTSPYPQRTSLFEADKTADADVVLSTPFVITAMATRISTDTVPDANSTPPWKDFGFVRLNLQSKYSQEGRMGPNTVLEAVLPQSVRGR